MTSFASEVGDNVAELHTGLSSAIAAGRLAKHPEWYGARYRRRVRYALFGSTV